MDTLSTEAWIAVGSICLSEFVVSAILVGIILSSHLGAARAKDWASTTGTVLMSTLQARRSSDGHYVNYPVVVYQYRVGGMSYESRKITPGLEWGGTGAGKVVARYPTGSQVTVYYNPANPVEALLERKPPSFIIWLWVILALVNIFLCGLGACLAFTV
ncbi:MAG: DUF3592 domain-containing protein [Chloroflexi bacterium]|nr:MAG: DUF3592 domain-containing protein [Chloroflexota bacterium]